MVDFTNLACRNLTTFFDPKHQTVLTLEFRKSIHRFLPNKNTVIIIPFKFLAQKKKPKKPSLLKKKALCEKKRLCV